MDARLKAAMGQVSRSVGEDDLGSQIKAAGLPEPVREHCFDPGHGRWRFDFAWPHRMVAVEIEGGTWSAGRHTRGAGFAADLLKYNLAVWLGWNVFRFSTGMVTSGGALRVIKLVLQEEERH